MAWSKMISNRPIEKSWTPVVTNTTTSLVGNSTISKYSVEDGIVSLRGYMNSSGSVLLNTGWEITAPVPRFGTTNIPVGEYYLYVEGGSAISAWSSLGVVMMNATSLFFLANDRPYDSWPKAPTSHIHNSSSLSGSTYSSINFYAFYEAA